MSMSGAVELDIEPRGDLRLAVSLGAGLAELDIEPTADLRLAVSLGTGRAELDIEPQGNLRGIAFKPARVDLDVQLDGVLANVAVGEFSPARIEDSTELRASHTSALIDLPAARSELDVEARLAVVLSFGTARVELDVEANQRTITSFPTPGGGGGGGGSSAATIELDVQCRATNFSRGGGGGVVPREYVRVRTSALTGPVRNPHGTYAPA